MKPPKLWIGVDPGKTGAIVVLDDDGAFVDHLPMPILGKGTKTRERVSVAAIADWYHRLPASRTRTWAIERVSSMPEDGVVQAFRFGAAVSAIYACAEWQGDSFVDVLPRSWQKLMLAGYPKSGRAQIKASAALAAADRWPELRVLLGVKKNWGAADAALIAESARLLSHAQHHAQVM